MTRQAEIERFIIDELLAEPLPSIDPELPLFSSGMIDSMGMLRLITFLEEQFGIEVGDGDVGDDNFGTLARLSAFVDGKTGGEE